MKAQKADECPCESNRSEETKDVNESKRRDDDDLVHFFAQENKLSTQPVSQWNSLLSY